MKRCDRCEERQATVHMTDIANSEIQKETHLCGQCAETEGLEYNVELDLSELIPEEIDLEEIQELKQREEELAQLECPNCGMTFEQFRSTRRLGCPEDYELFSTGLDPLLEKIHDRLEHRGKVPSRVSDEVKMENEIQQLERKLQSLVEKEKFEDAAEVRDQIQKRKDQLAEENGNNEESETEDRSDDGEEEDD